MCASDRLVTLHRGIRDRYSVATGRYDFLRCVECGSATLAQPPPPEMLSALYPQHYTFKTPTDDQGGAQRVLAAIEWRLFYRPLYHQRLRTFRRLTGLRAGSVLEVGCGSGLLLGLLRASGYDVEGVEISASDVAYARDHLGLRVFHGTLEGRTLAADRYDAVILLSVLEHVFEPLATVSEVRRILKPGGWIVLGLPILDSLQGRLLGSRWGQVTEAPRHLLIPSRAGVRRLLTGAGFEDVRSAPMPLIENAGTVALSLVPGAATPLAYGRSGPLVLIARRFVGALLTLPSLLVALAERFEVAGVGAGTMMFCGRKPSR